MNNIIINIRKVISIIKNLKYIRNIDIENFKGKHIKIDSPYKISKTTIGDYSYIGYNSQISLTKIGKFCSIGPNFFCGSGIHPINGISTSPMFYSINKQNGVSLTTKTKVEERKEIFIGNDVFIGANVTILDGIIIGDGAIIGAGAVVSKNIPAYAVAVGSPIKILKYRFEENVISRLLDIKWWDFPEDNLHLVEKNFFNIEGFFKNYGSI